MHNEICAICLNNNGTFITTICNHKFHEHCLNEWTQYRENCPICRGNLYRFDFKKELMIFICDILQAVRIGLLLGYCSEYL
jgi:hypothetical protein